MLNRAYGVNNIKRILAIWFVVVDSPKGFIGGINMVGIMVDNVKAVQEANEKQIAKHYPKPEYNKCNAGHQLIQMYDAKRNVWVWDCPTCIDRMQDAEQYKAETENNY